jgi:hypothetical protein
LRVMAHCTNLRISTRSSLVTLLTALGLTPIAACDRHGEETTEATASAPSTKQESPKGKSIKPRLRCTGSAARGEKPGYERCSEGYRHRVAATTCSSPLPRDRTCIGGGDEDLCKKDSDCAVKPNGFCQGPGSRGASVVRRQPTIVASASPPNLKIGCKCSYGCVTDADCGDGELCLCGTPVGECVTANCRTDADCKGEMLCAELDPYFLGGLDYACQTRKDQCNTHAQCTDGKSCVFEHGHRDCRHVPVPGRPFLIDQAARTAEPTSRIDWLAADGATASLEGLFHDRRAKLAAHWTRAGLMEHASVAAFARFALQLLAQGAPASLVEGALAAMADETAHARMCFSLASTYAGDEIGPGPLDVGGALDEQTSLGILRLVIREGCIGETVAALEAREAQLWANDAVVAGVLAKIAEDESRHAELAWRYVAWALANNSEHASTLLDEIEAAMNVAPSSATSESLLCHGVLEASRSHEIRHRAMRDVVLPCAHALLDHLMLDWSTIRGDIRDATGSRRTA